MELAARKTVTIGGRPIGPDHPCLVIAEIGVNHNGDFDRARRMIDAAAQAGADAVKFQTFKTELVMARDTPKADYQKVNDGAQNGMFDMVRALELPLEDFARLAEHCREAGVMFMSTAFDPVSLDAVIALAPPALKWPSGEIDNLPLLRQGGAAGLPVILSSGMSGLAEIEAAVAALEAAGSGDIVLLHCVSNYPAAPADLNLRAIPALTAAFGLPVGFSDHSLGNAAALAARALGMCVLEKHFTLDRTLPGPDHRASIEADELRSLVADLRTVEAALGDGIKRLRAAEANTLAVARRSLHAACDLAEGAVLSATDVIPLRPAGGISPMQIDSIVGRRLRRPLAAGTMLAPADLI